jgi:predicted dehydrogenase
VKNRVVSLNRRDWLFAAPLLGVVAQAAVTTPVRLPRKVRLAILGLDGHTSEILDPLKRLPDVELVAISDPSREVRRKFVAHRAYSSVAAYEDPQELLRKSKPDIAAICGDNGSRAALILACARMKIHVIAEKPLAIEKSDLQQIQKSVADSRIGLTMLLPMRFLPAFRKMQQVVAAGQIGQVAQISAQKSYQLGERPEWMQHHATFGGIIPYIGIHMVDLMRFTTGRDLVDAASFQAHIAHPEMKDMENTAVSIFRLDNGGNANLRLDYFRPAGATSHGDDRLRIAGTKGVIEYREEGGVTLITEKQPLAPVNVSLHEESLFVDFLEHVYNGKPSGVSLRDVYRANEIVLAAREAAESNRIVKT